MLRPSVIRDALREAVPFAGSRLGVTMAALALLYATTPLSAQFAVYPATIELAHDGISTEIVTVENQGDAALEARVYLSDYERGPSGLHEYLLFGAHERTCSDRLAASPASLSLAAGETGQVSVRVLPGAEACWGIVFVEMRSKLASGLTVVRRIGVQVVAEPEGLAREGEVVAVAADSTAEPALLVAFENQGRGLVYARGEIEVRDLSGEIVEVVPVERFQVLPGRQRHVRISLDSAALEPGRYLAIPILDFGGAYLAGGQALVEVKR